MVLGASDNQVLVVSRLIHSQAHNWTKVTSKLSSRGKPNAGKRNVNEYFVKLSSQNHRGSAKINLKYMYQIKVQREDINKVMIYLIYHS